MKQLLKLEEVGTSNDSKTKQPESKKTEIVKYTWSNLFMQSLAFAKAIVALNIPERSCVTI
jgi:hypothetical protein